MCGLECCLCRRSTATATATITTTSEKHPFRCCNCGFVAGIQKLESSACGRAFLHFILVLMSFGSVLLFFAGVYYTQLTGGPSGPTGIVIKIAFLLIGISMWLASIALWVWFCSRDQRVKKEQERELEEARRPRATEEGRGVPGAPDYVHRPGGDGAVWSSDSSTRVWGMRGNGE